MRKNALILLLLIAGAAAAHAAAAEILAGAQERPSLLGGIAKDWQLYTVLAMLLMVGLVALAYAIANAFSLPDLRAWADVELGEIFASALLLIFIMGIVFFIDEAVRGLVAPSFPTACPAGAGGFCPANIAEDYLNSYMESAGKVYRDIMVKNIDKAKEATAGGMTGAQDMMYGYISFRFREKPEEMVIVEMYDQLLQDMGTVLGSLSAQGFVLRFMTMRLAPVAIFLGIILRSFFLTRKLGGLLLAFGLGFLIVFPLTYALAWFTLDATVYGGQRAPTGQLTPCPEVCKPLSRIVEYSGLAPASEVGMEEVRTAAYEDCMDSLGELDEGGRSVECVRDAERRRNLCIEGCKERGQEECLRGCTGLCREGGLETTEECRGGCREYCLSSGIHEPPEMATAEETAAWDRCMLPCEAERGCAGKDAEWNACFEGCAGDMGCGPDNPELDARCGEECPLEECGVVSDDPEGYCTAEAEKKISMMGGERIVVGGRVFGYCPLEPCGFPIPYHKSVDAEPCYTPSWSSGEYAVAPNICNARWFEPDDPAYAEFDESELYGCPEECRVLAPLKPILTMEAGRDGYPPSPGQTDLGCYNRRCKERYEDEEEYCRDKLGCTEENMYSCCIRYNWPADWACKRYGTDCPSQCMWITTSGKTDETCPEECKKYMPNYEGLDSPQDPLYLWENNLSEKTCVYIIPDVVFEEPEKCAECAFVAEKGLTFKPQMVFDCATLCGAESSVVMAEDPATMTNKVGGLIGPDEVKSVSKLMIPAYVLPLFNLAVTLMFVMTLSPMLGGDIDIPGIMRMIS